MSTSSSTRDQYVVPADVTRDVDESEVLRRGRQWDVRLRGLASASMNRDEAVLAYSSLIESAVHLQRLDPTQLDAAIAPVLDHISAPLDATTRSDQPIPEHLEEVSSWIAVCLEYESLAGAVINVMQGRMSASEVSCGRLVFWPSSSMHTELRNRWFEQRWRASRQSIGNTLAPTEASLKNFAETADRWVSERIAEGKDFVPPKEEWLTNYADDLADRLLDAQFDHVSPAEVWGSLPASAVIAALRPLYRRASRRYFLHTRVFAALKASGHSTPVPPSCIDILSISELCDEVQHEANLNDAQAREFVESLVRNKGEERHRLSAYPLIPLSNQRAVVLPSSVLYSNWPLVREQAVGRARDSSIGKHRDRRHTEQLLEGFRKAGVAMVTSSLLIDDAEQQRTLTDLDLVFVAADKASVFVAQVKSFVTPTNLIDLTKSARDTGEGVRQCLIAEYNVDLVRTAIEQRFSIKLADDWTLHQAVAVEAIAGHIDIHPSYPVVTVEWLVGYGIPNCNSSPRALWELARDLPDGIAFMRSLSPFFSLHDAGFGAAQPEALAILALV